ncbi:MAG: septum formation initiator family protein [Bernardetiaceae bacterium]|nr:septum formation initiator family protein [Bernardetiaceae bacterium]
MKEKIKQWAQRLNNFYFIFGGLFIIWMLFFDGNNFYNQYQMRKQINQLQQERNYYKANVEQLRREIEELERNPKALEKFAREKYLMKKPQEDIYIVGDK